MLSAGAAYVAVLSVPADAEHYRSVYSRASATANIGCLIGLRVF